MFFVGEFTKPVVAKDIVHIRNSVETESLLRGTVLCKWDHVFEWDDDCVKASVLEQWRQLADPYCDAALVDTFPSATSSTGIDLLESVQHQASKGPGPARDFIEHVNSPPPESIRAPHVQILRGQAFFYKYSAPILAALMHFSLAGGFASARITRVLHSVSYLVPGKSSEDGKYSVTQVTNDRTYKRLMETLQMVLDVMGGYAALVERETGKLNPPNAPHALVPGEEGWRSTVRVRLLHGVARRRIMDRLRHHESKPGTPSYDFDADGYAINQEDMAATLASFSIAPLWCLARQGYHPSTSEMEDYLAIWKHTGFYLGIEPSFLSRHFSSIKVGEKFLASVIVHLLETPIIQPEGQTPTSVYLPPPTMPILRAISGRPPFPTTLAYNCALTRFLIGDPLADHLEVPRTPLTQYVRVRIRLLINKVPYLFGKVYRIRNWEARYTRLSREGLTRVVRWQLGMRRTAFRPRQEDGDLAKGVQEAESIVPNMTLGNAFVREWRFLIREMIGVIVGTAVLCAIAGWKFWKLVS
ncbi:transmembrane protein [Ceratobasidium sp. AG-Ba]|nr:transmembrane protein [Ceratobasidium sp. AG-Ba]